MLKRILVFFISLAALITAAVLVVTWNTPASHPGLAKTDLPKLIPTRALFADPRAAFGHVVSVDAKFVFIQEANLLGRRSVVRDIETDQIIAEFPADLRHMRWHPTKPRLRFIVDGHDWEVDLFAPEKENWQRISPVRLTGGWTKNEIPTDADMPVLTWGKEHQRSAGHMWLVSQDGLTAEKIAEGNDNTRYWVFSQQMQPVLRRDSLDDRTDRLFRKTDSGWEPLIDIDLNDAFHPLSQPGPDERILARSAIGRDKAALASFDINTGQEEVLHENPNADIGWTTSLNHDGVQDFFRLGADSLTRKALTQRGQVFLDVLDSFPQPVSLGSVTPAGNGRYVIAAVSGQGRSYVYPLIDLETGTYELLGEYHLRRFKERFVSEKLVHITARDGLRLPAVLTMPKDPVGPIPFVVDIHGGPARHSGPGYHHFTQFLVNRGYGVLAVNFRGSTGFGKAFQAKGFREFGRAMQDDITDAALWLVDKGLADPDALAVMGSSYGGYSAALAMTRNPGLFDAAIVEFPMLDSEFQSKYHPGHWDSGIYGWQRYFGDPENPDDLELMKRYSPVNRVADLHGPVMVLGGLKDQITAIQQVRDFAKAAEAAGKTVETHYFTEAGHGLNHWRDKLRRARLVEDFLAKHLGGRSGGFELVELAPSFIK